MDEQNVPPVAPEELAESVGEQADAIAEEVADDAELAEEAIEAVEEAPAVEE